MEDKEKSTDKCRYYYYYMSTGKNVITCLKIIKWTDLKCLNYLIINDFFSVRYSETKFFLQDISATNL